jgi:DNA-directed RNA polymerase subunit beta'
VVLDDRTARNYDLEGNLGMFAGDEMIGGQPLGDNSERRLGNNNGENGMMIDDDMLIDDHTEAP